MKNPNRSNQPAFTLIELLAVITIIVILAGITVGSMSYINEKQAREKAKVQIALLSKALEDYKMDNGSYPPTANKIAATAPTGTSTSNILYQRLFADGNSDQTKKIYLPELDPANNKLGWTTGTGATGVKIVDPWGNEYCYRSAFGTPPTNGTAPVNTATQNPEFDLWSMGKDGKTKVGASDSPNDPLNKDDIRNF